MACLFKDDDDNNIAIATATAPANEYAARIAELEARVDKQDRDIIALRSLLMSMGLRQAAAVAATKKADGEPLTAEQEDAIISLSGAIGFKNLRYINDCCIVGTTTDRARLGLKVTRKVLTLSKYNCPPETTIELDQASRAILFP